MSVDKATQPIQRTPVIRLNGGVNEVSPVTAMPQNELVSMNNWRIDEDGMRMAKRNGVAEVTGINAAIGAKDVYGFATYYNNDSAFCMLVVTEDQIWRKIGGGSWTSIHTWSTNIAHPVKIQHIQDKIIIVTEVQNRMILENGGGSCVQLGITAPATLPTLTKGFEGGASEILDDDMDYADTAAMNAVWTDADNGGAVSELSETDPNSDEGPDGDSKYMRFYDAAPGAGRYARRHLTLYNIPGEYDLELDIYFDEAGYRPQNGHFQIQIYNGDYLFEVIFAGSYVKYYDGSSYKSMWTPPGNDIRDRWYRFKFTITESKFTFFVDGVDKGEFTFDRADTTNSGLVNLKLFTGDATYGDGDVYIDRIKISGEGSGGLNGIYRYAVTYARNGGNYAGESNPIKSTVGSATLVGAGLDDLTSGGTYTGAKDRTIRVKIDGTGTPDTITWSDDGGETWLTTGLPITETMYLSYGIELTWAATTGHTDTNYWNMNCKAFAANAANEQITISSIPTSSDGNQVTQRKIYRTAAGGTEYFHLFTLNDNSTTTFVDNLPDRLLGLSMEEDHDIAPLGKYSEWWDDRLWIFDDDENIVYYSQIRYPDHFYTRNRRVSMRSGKIDDEGTGLISYESHLYAFKRDAIFFIRKQQGGYYGRYRIKGNIGNIAPWALQEVRGLLTWVSYRGWEIFNGKTTYTAEFTLPLRATIATIDKTAAHFITSAQLQSTNEILLSIPDRTGGNSAITCVYNYKDGGFYTFSYSKIPSCLVETRDTNKELQLYMGTRDGYVGTVESGTQDFSTNITAVARTAWINLGPKYVTPELFELEYEAPTGDTLLIDHYVNMDKDSVVQNSLSGSTPSATDRSIRLPIKNQVKYAQQGRFHALEFSNAENVGESLKVNTWQMFYTLDANFARGEIKGD